MPVIAILATYSKYISAQLGDTNENADLGHDIRASPNRVLKIHPKRLSAEDTKQMSYSNLSDIRAIYNSCMPKSNTSKKIDTDCSFIHTNIDFFTNHEQMVKIIRSYLRRVGEMALARNQNNSQDEETAARLQTVLHIMIGDDGHVTSGTYYKGCADLCCDIDTAREVDPMHSNSSSLATAAKELRYKEYETLAIGGKEKYQSLTQEEQRVLHEHWVKLVAIGRKIKFFMDIYGDAAVLIIPVLCKKFVGSDNFQK